MDSDASSGSGHVGGEGDDRWTAVDPRVQAALDRLAELDATDVSAHPSVYDGIQRSLAAVLDDGPAVPSEQ
jgi:hypothetical protein